VASLSPHVASLVGARSVVFYDTEHASIIRNLSFPFADVICTPACFEADLGDNHHRYPGYHELAYLHPDRFTPDPDVREAVGVAPDDRFVVLRLGDWGPHTTSARAGSTTTGPSSSDWRPPGRRSASPPKATSTTTCASTSYRSSPNASTTCWPRPTSTSARARRPRAECAVLRTPAVYVNSLPLGYLTELEEAYGLVHAFTDDDRHVRAVNRATAILQEDGDGGTWRRRRERLLADKCDVTDVVLDRLGAAAPVEP